MKDWGIAIAATAALVYIIHCIYNAASILGYRLDELHEKVDTLQEKIDVIEEKVDEIESNQHRKNYVNPIDL